MVARCSPRDGHVDGGLLGPESKRKELLWSDSCPSQAQKYNYRREL